MEDGEWVAEDLMFCVSDLDDLAAFCIQYSHWSASNLVTRHRL